MVSLITAVIGDYDTPKTHVEQTVDVEHVYIDDLPTAGLHPRTVAKLPKLRPWRYAGGDGPWIWLDGSAEIISPTFVEDILNGSSGPISQFEHPQRYCIYPEAAVSATMLKYDRVPVLEQANHYRSIGHPAGWGLWATGVIIYRERLDYLADLWLAEIKRWGYQDQISQPVALRAAGLRPSRLPSELWANPWIRWHAHRSDV